MNYKTKLYAAAVLGLLGAALTYLYLSNKEQALISRASQARA